MQVLHDRRCVSKVGQTAWMNLLKVDRNLNNRKKILRNKKGMYRKKRPTIRMIRALTTISTICVLAIGLSGLLDHAAREWSFWERIAKNDAVMAISSSGGMILLGLTLVLLETYQRRFMILEKTLALVVILAALVNLLLYIYNDLSSIEILFMPNYKLDLDGRLSLAGSISFVLGGACIMLAHGRKRSQRRWFSGLATLGLSIQLVYLAGRFYAAPSIYTIPFFSAMSVRTVLGLTMFFVALLFVRPYWGWMRIVIGRLDGSVMVRRMLPVIIIVPVTMGWVAVQAADYSLFEANFRISLWVIFGIGIFSILVLVNGSIQNVISRRRQLATRSLQSAMKELQEAAIERERLIEHLKVKADELQLFSYAISHDLNSPIATIETLCQLALNDFDEGESEELREDLKEIQKAANDLQIRSDVMLKLATSGAPTDNLTSIDMKELFVKTEKLLGKSIDDCGAQICYLTPTCFALGDSPRLTQVAQNLIENALKYRSAERDLIIKIYFTVEKDKVICRVCDNGQGIDGRYHHRIFDLFKRADDTKRGAGIGLAMCKRIIEAHSGKIWVESKGKDQGSDFVFTLKRSLDAVHPLEPALGKGSLMIARSTTWS